MKASKFTESQIAFVLKQGDEVRKWPITSADLRKVSDQSGRRLSIEAIRARYTSKRRLESTQLYRSGRRMPFSGVPIPNDGWCLLLSAFSASVHHLGGESRGTGSIAV